MSEDPQEFVNACIDTIEQQEGNIIKGNAAKLIRSLSKYVDGM